MLRTGLTIPRAVAARVHTPAAPAAAGSETGWRSSAWKAMKDPDRLMHLVLSGISLSLALRLVRTGHAHEEEADDLRTQLRAAEQRTERALSCAPGLAVAAGLPTSAAGTFGTALRAEMASSRAAEAPASSGSVADGSARRPVARPNAVF